MRVREDSRWASIKEKAKRKSLSRSGFLKATLEVVELEFLVGCHQTLNEGRVLVSQRDKVYNQRVQIVFVF